MVAPGEIEAFLQTHPDVDQAFVVGVPDPEINEAPVAYVIPTRRARLDGGRAARVLPREDRLLQDSARRPLRRRRAAHPGPHGDKVQRGKLRERAIEELGR